MEGYVVSLNDNVLSVSLLGSAEVFEKELPSDVAAEGSIIGVEQFAENLGDLLLESFPDTKRKFPLHFLVPSNEVVLNFITASKKTGDSSGQKLESEAEKRLAAVALTSDDVYFSFPKIAPFVYQLVAVKKEVLEKYLQVGSLLGFEVKSVVPWVFLLPKFLPEPTEPKIFVLKSSGEETLVLSELGGVYYVGRFDEKKAHDMKKLVKELSVYERNRPIDKIYVYGMKSFDLGSGYEVTHLDIKSIHDLYAPGTAGDVLYSHVNLINSLPIIEPAKNMIPTYVVVAVAALLLLLGGVFAKSLFTKPAPQQGAVRESTESTESTPPVTLPTEETPQIELNKAYLKVRIENGTNVGGLAGRTRDHLATFGYEIVSIGDADESDREITLVKFSSENAIYKDLLATDLKEMYTDIEIQEDLSSDLEYDVLVIAGGNEK